MSFAVGFLIEEFNPAQIADTALPILYGGVISIGIAYTLQVVAQQDAKPAQAAILLSLESVFAVIWGRIFLEELLSVRALIGSGLMLTGMILSQLRKRKNAEG